MQSDCPPAELERAARTSVALDRLAAEHDLGSLAYPGVQLLALRLRIAVEATQLPGAFHRDLADQIIVATARLLACPLLTLDSKILAYPDVRAFSLPPGTA